MAVRARCGVEAAMRRIALLIGFSLLTACASSPPPPAWQANARSALNYSTSAYLSGDSRLAERDFIRARAEIARTGRLDLLARAELVRCAARVASLEFDDCPGYQALAQDAGPAERAYAELLAGRWTQLDSAQLPKQYHKLLTAPTDPTTLAEIADPVSRMIAAGLLFRYGQVTPQGISLATETASAEGWRRSLLAWLGVKAQRAKAAGDAEAASRIERRIKVVTGTP